MDLNPSPLEVAARRLHRFQPKTHQANVLEPFGSQWMMKRLNRAGAFTNFDDDLDSLKTQLSQRFEDAQFDVVGAVGIFSTRT